MKFHPLGRFLSAAPIIASALWLALCVASTTARAGLIINPSYGTNLNIDANAAAIKAVINQVAAEYAADFADPITVNIKFQEINSGLASSSWWYYQVPYSQYLAALNADKTTADDTTALASLPGGSNNPVNSTTMLSVKTANMRALGIAPNTSGLAGGVDGIVSVNTHITDTGSPGTTGQYSLKRALEHEIDEVLGLGSGLGTGLSDPMPEDLFRYSTSGARSYTTAGDDAWLSLDGGLTRLVQFNQASGGDYGDWWSGNGTGNAGPTPPPRIQDAYNLPGASQPLGVELRALDAIGYNFVPEPSTIVLGALASATGVLTLRKRSRRRAALLRV